MKKGIVPRTLKTSPEEDKLIEEVQIFYGVEDFSAMTLKLYRERQDEIREKIDQMKALQNAQV